MLLKTDLGPVGAREHRLGFEVVLIFSLNMANLRTDVVALAAGGIPRTTHSEISVH